MRILFVTGSYQNFQNGAISWPTLYVLRHSRNENFTFWIVDVMYIYVLWSYVMCRLRYVALRYVATPVEGGDCWAQSTHWNRVEIRGMYLSSQLERTHNFVCDGRYSENGGERVHYHHQPGLIFPSWWNVRQKMAVATLYILWCWGWQWIS